jgi:hypothetical protein
MESGRLENVKINIPAFLRKYGNFDIDNSWGKDITVLQTIRSYEGYTLKLNIKIDFDLKKIKE